MVPASEPVRRAVPGDQFVAVKRQPEVAGPVRNGPAPVHAQIDRRLALERQELLDQPAAAFG
jgi:hypothetical protein